jgi:uncharacterized cupin superfamily protein
MTETLVGRLSHTPAAPPPAWAPHLAGMFREARLARPLGITQFGINHVTLQPGYEPGGNHWHEEEDEFVFVLSGEVTLIDDNGEHILREGDFAAFPAGAANAHCLANRSDALAAYLVAGTRHRGKETLHYPREGVTRTLLRDATGDRVEGSVETRPGA